MSKHFLVGHTGFVGSNLAASHSFDGLYNSKNINDAFGKKPDLLVYSGVRAEMFLANSDPNADFAMIETAIDNISQIDPETIVLISTIAVYPDTHGADEDTEIKEEELLPYGKNRYFLENWVGQNFKKHLIVRLPAIYGMNLKKNFLYDYIHVIPSLLAKNLFDEFVKKEPAIKNYFALEDNGFYRCRPLLKEDFGILKACFERLGFTALNFTDSRSKYQFYPLKRLWDDIELALSNNIQLLNLVTPPMRIQDIYWELKGEAFKNELAKQPFDYDLRTKHSRLFNRNDGYIMGKNETLQEIKSFIDFELSKRGE